MSFVIGLVNGYLETEVTTVASSHDSDVPGTDTKAFHDEFVDGSFVATVSVSVDFAAICAATVIAGRQGIEVVDDDGQAAWV